MLAVPAHPPKVKYTVPTQNMRQEVNQAAGSHPDHHHLRQAVIRSGSLYLPTPAMVIVTRSYHDAIHAVRDQQQRPVTRHLLKQQVQLASQKALVNQQIKSSTPDPPKCNAMTLPR